MAEKFKTTSFLKPAAATILILLLAACSGNAPAADVKQEDGADALRDAQYDARLKAEQGFQRVAADAGLELYIDAATAQAAVKELSSGYWWRTNPAGRETDLPEPGGSGDFISSQFTLRYMDDKDKPFERTSYADSVALGQFDFAPVENGVRVNYQVNKPRTKYLVPPVVGKERFEALCGKLPEERREEFLAYYILKTSKGMSPEGKAWQESVFPALRHGDIYVLASGYDRINGITASDLMLQMLEPFFLEAGYTEKDLEFDTRQNSLENEAVMDYGIRLSVEYRLDNGSLVVTVPQNGLEYDPKALKLTELSLLPFFGAGGQSDSGYLMVPDGSGALIGFNNGKVSVSAYRKQVYGRDRSLEMQELLPGDGAQIHFPVYGLKNAGHAFLSVIEKGDAVSWLNADTGGKLNAYNYVYPSFVLVESGVETNAILNQTGSSLYQARPFDSDLQLRYLFLREGAADYTGMARAYQQYLLETGQLAPADDAGGGTPFLMTAIGAITYDSTFLGFPMKAQKVLTGYSQARILLEALLERSISDIRFRYLGWSNGGVNHTSYTRLKLLRGAGGFAAFESLRSFAEKNAILFYPDVDFQYLPRKSALDGYSKVADGARNLSNNVAYDYAFNRSTLKKEKESDTSIISPGAYGRVMNGFFRNYGELDVKRISVAEMGYHLNADYNKNAMLNRQESAGLIRARLGEIKADGYGVMVSAGNVYALQSAEFVCNVPVSSGNHFLFDAAVPFYQTVIRGVIPFSGEPLNLSGDFRQEVLRGIEFATSPSFQWMFEENIELKETEFHYYSANYKMWLDDAAGTYQEMKRALGEAGTGGIAGHTRLSERVSKTVYDNRTAVYVNYGTEAETAEGIRIPPEGFAVVKGGSPVQ